MLRQLIHHLKNLTFPGYNAISHKLRTSFLALQNTSAIVLLLDFAHNLIFPEHGVFLCRIAVLTAEETVRVGTD